MESARLSWGDTCILLQKGCKQSASFHCTSFFPPIFSPFSPASPMEAAKRKAAVKMRELMRPGRRTEGFWWDHAPGCQGSDTTGLGQELSSFSHSSHPRPTHPSWNRFFLAEGATGQTGIVFFLPKSQPSPATSVRVEMEQGRCFPTRSCFAEASQKQKKKKERKKREIWSRVGTAPKSVGIWRWPAAKLEGSESAKRFLAAF